MPKNDALVDALKELFEENPEEFDKKLKQAKAELELRDFTEIFHLMTCHEVHGNLEDRDECLYYTEVDLAGNEWSMSTHKKWTKKAGKFIQELIDIELITERSQVLEFLPALSGMFKEAERLRQSTGEGALVFALAMFPRMVKEFDLVLDIKWKEV